MNLRTVFELPFERYSNPFRTGVYANPLIPPGVCGHPPPGSNRVGLHTGRVADHVSDASTLPLATPRVRAPVLFFSQAPVLAFRLGAFAAAFNAVLHRSSLVSAASHGHRAEVGLRHAEEYGKGLDILCIDRLFLRIINEFWVA